VSEDQAATIPGANGPISGSTVARLRLLVIGVGSFQTYALPVEGELTIGRADNAYIRIEDAQVSRKHATLVISRSGIRIRDLGSINGTRVREQRVEPGKTADLQPGDVIDIGNTMLIVQYGATTVRPKHLWGHGVFEGRLEDECARAQREGASFAVVRLHVDGDAAPAEEVLAVALRPGDPIASYGPGEYELLLSSVTPEQADELTRQLIAQLAQKGAHGRVGIACFPRDGRTAEALVQKSGDAVRGRDLLAEDPATAAIVIEDGAMQRLHRLVERVAAGTISVLLLGETGVGKEVFAETIHRRSPRATKPFLRLNCAALAESLLESELFGHERGAFTGAVAQKDGLLETADGGTVFLDEIGELPLSTQVKLLRVIEERRVQRVGGTRPREIDVRFIAATNRDLEGDVQRGRFRQDLFFRLNGISLMIPPLRDRVGEIEALGRAFIRQAWQASGARSAEPTLEPAALELLERYSWPGNIRELRNVIERAVLLAAGGPITPSLLPTEKMGTMLVPSPDSGKFPAITVYGLTGSEAPRERKPNLKSEIEAFEKQRILDALERCGGNQTKAARRLGMSRRTLVSRLEEYGLPRPRKPKS
jgi:transcriptional regulator with GAF, ATPase, and Fis domain